MKVVEILLENERTITKLPWNGNVQIGWWQDNKVLRMYHGTNLDFVPSIAKDGLNRMDARTGMISLAFEPFTARAFAVMGGEARFLAAKAKAMVVSEDKRAVLVFDIPREFAFSYMDKNLHGNDTEHKKRLIDKSVYENWNSSDQQYYQLCELRLAKPLPPSMLVGYMIKGN